MENASKALIIAGAILLSILIIALGVFIFNKAKSATDVGDLSSQQAEAHNSTFQNYEGKITGTQYKALIDAVRSNNESLTDATITLSGKSSATDLADMKATVNSSDQYEIKITAYYGKTKGQYSGYISTMTASKTNN